MYDPRKLIQTVKRQILSEDNNPIMKPLARRGTPTELDPLPEEISEAVKKRRKVKNKVEINPFVETIHPNK